MGPSQARGYSRRLRRGLRPRGFLGNFRPNVTLLEQRYSRSRIFSITQSRISSHGVVRACTSCDRISAKRFHPCTSYPVKRAAVISQRICNAREIENAPWIIRRCEDLGSIAEVPRSSCIFVDFFTKIFLRRLTFYPKNIHSYLDVQIEMKLFVKIIVY